MLSYMLTCYHTILYAIFILVIYNFICHIQFYMPYIIQFYIYVPYNSWKKADFIWHINMLSYRADFIWHISRKNLYKRKKKKDYIFWSISMILIFSLIFSFWFCEIYEVGLFMRLFDAEFGAELYGFLISCYARIWLTYLSPGYLSMCSRFLSLCFLTMFGRDPEEQYKSTQRTPEIHSARSLIGANKNLGVWRTPMGYSEIRGSMGYFVITSRGVLRKFSHHFGFFIVFFPFALDFTRWDCPWDDLTRWKDVLLRWQIEITSRTIVRRESPISFRRRAIRDTCSNCSWCNRTEAARNRIA